MRSYRLYFFTPRAHGIARMTEFDAADDAAALARSHAQRGAHALELWTGTRKIAEIDATDLASRVIRSRRMQAGDLPPPR